MQIIFYVIMLVAACATADLGPRRRPCDVVALQSTGLCAYLCGVAGTATRPSRYSPWPEAFDNWSLDELRAELRDRFQLNPAQRCGAATA